jgi:RYamide receptor
MSHDWNMSDSGLNTSLTPSPEMLGYPQPLSDISKAFISMLYAVVTVVAVGGNAIVCCIVATQRRMQTVTNFFIASLACSDALMASLCIPLSFVTNIIIDYWPFGVVMCPITQYAQVSRL